VLPPGSGGQAAEDGDNRVREPAGPIPLARRCTPDEVAAAVVFLLESDAITGQIVFVDGGQHLV
jgi:NAD(P)-dependent dehydrogenase (short-subunit alcohol dehydrogenase family)